MSLNKLKTVRLSERDRQEQQETQQREQTQQIENEEITKDEPVGIESRKRFYEEMNQTKEDEYQEKRGCFSEFIQRLRQPKQRKEKELPPTKISEIKLEVNDKKNGQVEIEIFQQFNKKFYPLETIRINDQCDFDKEITMIKDRIQKWIYDNLLFKEIKERNENENQPVHLTRLPTVSQLSDIRRQTTGITPPSNSTNSIASTSSSNQSVSSISSAKSNGNGF